MYEKPRSFEALQTVFLQRHIEACFTFADIAETELDFGNIDQAHSAVGQARRGYESIVTSVSTIATDQAAPLMEALAVLAERLSDLDAKLADRPLPVNSSVTEEISDQ